MIQIQIKEESQLYNQLDPNRNRVSEEVYNYLKSYCTESESKKHEFDKLNIISDELVDAHDFKRALHDTIRREQEGLECQIATNKRRAIWGYVVGIALSMAGVLIASLTDKVLLALVSFFGTMVLNEAVAISTKIIPDIRQSKNRLNLLLNCEVEVTVTQK